MNIKIKGFLTLMHNFDRFSKDVDSADTIIPPTIRAFFTCFFGVRIVLFCFIFEFLKVYIRCMKGLKTF